MITRSWELTQGKLNTGNLRIYWLGGLRWDFEPRLRKINNHKKFNLLRDALKTELNIEVA